MANGCRRVAHMRDMALSGGDGVADPWARGHSNGRRGFNRFKIFKWFENVQTLINPNLTFPCSKN
jgi:hypothetical protein